MTIADPTSYEITIKVSADEFEKLNTRAGARRQSVHEYVKAQALREDVQASARVVQTVKADLPEDTGGKKK